MGFRCAAAGCTSDSDTPLHKYPWMRTVTWVKWPKRVAVSNRWKRLGRRGGKDGLIVGKITRLCSRHFDKQSIGEGDPKYFAWNNWGDPVKCRSRPVLRLIQKENEVVGCVHTLSSDQTVPGIGTEVTVDTCQANLAKVELEVCILYICIVRISVTRKTYRYFFVKRGGGGGAGRETVLLIFQPTRFMVL